LYKRVLLTQPVELDSSLARDGAGGAEIGFFSSRGSSFSIDRLTKRMSPHSHPKQKQKTNEDHTADLYSASAPFIRLDERIIETGRRKRKSTQTPT
jgi:hypothetical protein